MNMHITLGNAVGALFAALAEPKIEGIVAPDPMIEFRKQVDASGIAGAGKVSEVRTLSGYALKTVLIKTDLEDIRVDVAGDIVRNRTAPNVSPEGMAEAAAPASGPADTGKGDDAVAVKKK